MEIRGISTNLHFCLFLIFLFRILLLYVLQLEASEHQLVFIKLGIGKIVLGDIKPVTANETPLVEVFVAGELGFADDIEVLVEDDNGELTPFKVIKRGFVCLEFIREFSYPIIHITVFVIHDVMIFGSSL